VSVLDQATKQQITIFQANRSTSELALRTIHSDEYRQDFERFVGYVLDTVKHLTLTIEYGYGEPQFNLDWREYNGLFPYDLPIFSNSVADALIRDWIDKTILIQANSVLRFTDISISLDGMGWRDNLLSFAATEPPVEKLQSMENLRKALGNGEMAKAKERVA
jgi:hypothetical protein